MTQVHPVKQDELLEKVRQAILYAVVDAADAPAVPEYLQSLEPSNWKCLYQGKSLRDYWAVAPYLVRVTPEVLHWIPESLDRDSWGIFVQSTVGFNETYSHLRKLQMTRHPDGRISYFRYYDPRVIGVFLKMLTAEQMHQVFGPFEAFVYSCEEQLLKAPAPESHANATCTSTLTISESQVAEFQDLSMVYYVRRLNDYLAMEIPDHWDGKSLAGPSLLREMIRQGQTLGLQSERALAAFTELAIRIGRTPDENLQQRQMLRILEDQEAMLDWPANRDALVYYLQATNDAV